MKRILFGTSFFFLIVSVFVGFVSFVSADTTSTDVTIEAIVGTGAVCGNGIEEGVEACDNGGSNGSSCPATCSLSCTTRTCGGGGGDTTNPSISNVVEVVGVTTSSVSWSASDNVSVSSCSFEYGLTDGYGTSGTVVGTYTVSLAGLSASTEYFYHISCSDTSGNSDSETGSFVTISESSSVTVTLISTSTTQTSAQIVWDASTTIPKSIVSCTLGYGVGNYISIGVVSGSYQSTLSGLTPNMAYQCRITCIDSNNEIGTAECPFITLSDSTPPPDVSSFTANGVVAANNLSWQYSESVSDFAYYRIEWSLGSCPARGAGALLQNIASVAQLSIQHAGLTNSTTYYYRLSVYDTSGNASAGVCANATPSGVVETSVCGNNIVESGEQCDGTNLNGATCVSRGYDGGSLSCSNSCTFNVSSCTNALATCGNSIVNVGETCDDGNNNQNDSCTNLCQAAICGDNVIRSGVEQCDGSDLGGASCVSRGYAGGSLSCGGACIFDVSGCTGVPPNGVEQCTNGVDDDGDSLIDCSDPDCAGEPACRGVFACSDGADNDGDGLVDLQDPGCSSATDNDEYNSPNVTVTDHVTTTRYWIAERTIEVVPTQGVVKSLTGDQLTVGISEGSLHHITPSTTLVLVLRGQRYALTREADGMYRSDVLFPPVGRYDATIEIFYAEGLVDVVPFQVESAPFGIISDTERVRLADANVSLYAGDTVFDITSFRQSNPFRTDSSGTYGFVVPNGVYTLVVDKGGYAQRKTFSFQVTDHVINRSLELLALPETPVETIGFVLNTALQGARDVLEKKDDPRVEEAVQTVVAPTFVGVSAATLIPSLFSILLPLLRFLFLQPLYLVGKRKRQAWGVVYNSLNKLPIDLATIRLIDKTTGRVVQSRVTDAKGRYLFMVEPGQYLIEVFKQGYVFPTHLLSSVKEDGSFLDIYHGESIRVDEKDTQITPNIPVDPVDAKEKTIKRIVLEKWLRRLQHTVAIVSIVGAVISVYITPSVLTVVFLVIHTVLFVLFLRYVWPKKPKGWGLVYEHGTAQPVGRAVARLFSKQFDKLVATQVTDSKGRYSFLVGPNDYYVTFEKEGYVPEKTDSVVVKEENGLVVKDVGLKKGEAPSDVSPTKLS